MTYKYISIIITMVTVMALIYFPPYWKNWHLERWRAKWESQHITHYRYKLQIECFCNFHYFMPITIEVQDGQISSIVDAKGIILETRGIGDGRFDEVGTVDKLFDLIHEGVKNAYSIKPHFDEKFGFPTTIFIDWNQHTIDDERAYMVSDFEVLP